MHFSSQPKVRATSPSTADDDDEWSNFSHSDEEVLVWESSDSEDETPKVTKTPTGSVNLSSSSRSEKEEPKEVKNTTSFCMPEVDLNPEDQAALDFILKKEPQKSVETGSVKTETSTTDKTLAMKKPSLELTKMVETCDSLAEKAANEVDAIAKALSRKLDGWYRFRTRKNSGSTPEQSLARCERFKANAGKLYKRFNSRAYAEWEKVRNEEHAKYMGIKSDCEVIRSNNREHRVKAKIAHRLDGTVANYAKWKEAVAEDDKGRVDYDEAVAKAYRLYEETSGDAWKKYELEREEARDAYDRVSAEYKRVKRLMWDLTEWSDFPEWKQVALFIGAPVATMVGLIAVANVWDFFTSTSAAPNPKVCSEAIVEMVKAATKEQFEHCYEQKCSVLWGMFGLECYTVS